MAKPNFARWRWVFTANHDDVAEREDISLFAFVLSGGLYDVSVNLDHCHYVSRFAALGA